MFNKNTLLSAYIETFLPWYTDPILLYDVEAPLLTFNELVVTVPVFITVCVVPVEVDPDVVPPVEEEVVDTYFPLTHPWSPL